MVASAITYCLTIALFGQIPPVGTVPQAPIQSPSPQHTAGLPPLLAVTPSPTGDKPGNALDEAKKLYREKKYAESLAVFRRVADRDPKNAEAFNGMGLCYHAQGKADLAIGAFQRAVERDPGVSSYHYNLARSYGSKQQFDLALIAYRKAIKDNPKNGLAYFELGNIYFMKKEFAKAKEHYEKAAAIFGEKTPPGEQALRNAIKSEMFMQRRGR
jgi:tetratricopeptide (TPR) repeat protein